MNWIDKKYKDHLGKRTFSSSLKKKGWGNMENLLNAKMPVSKPWWKLSHLWTIAGVAVVGISAGIAWFNMDNTESNRPSPDMEQPVMAPSQSILTGQPQKPDNPSSTNISPTEKVITDFDKQNAAQNIQAKVKFPPGQKDVNVKADENTAITVISNSSSPISKPFAETRKQLTVQNEAAEKESDFEPNAIGLNNTIAETSVSSKSIPESKDPVVPAVQAEKLSGIEPDGKSEDLVEENPSEIKVSDLPDIDRKTIQSPAGTEKSSEEDIASIPVVPKEVFKDEEPLKSESTDLDEPKKAEEKVTLQSSQKEVRKSNLAFAEIAAKSSIAAIENYTPLSLQRFSISVWGDYGFNGKIIKSNDNKYLEKRKQEEDAIWTTSTGFTMDYFLNQRWTFSVGAGWAEYGENLNYRFEKVDSVYLDGRYASPSSYSNISYLDSTRIVDSINHGHWNYSLVYSQRDTALEKNNGRTSWRYVEIPVLVGYRFGSGHIKPWLQTGFSLGIPSQTHYHYVSDDTFGLIEAGGQSKAPLQYNYILQMGVDCYLNRQWSIRIAGFGSYQLNSSFHSSLARQHYYRLGARLGIAYNF